MRGKNILDERLKCGPGLRHEVAAKQSSTGWLLQYKRSPEVGIGGNQPPSVHCNQSKQDNCSPDLSIGGSCDALGPESGPRRLADKTNPDLRIVGSQ